MQTNRYLLEYNPIRALVNKPGFPIFLFALAQPLLALAMRASPFIATFHALFTLTVGLTIAVFSKDKQNVGYVAAYIAGVEVLWRMTGAQIFWEAGKYFTILILGIALLRIRFWRRSSLPLIYFVLLCFSIPLTISYLGISNASREAISFNLSGPLALMICVLFFSQMTFNPELMKRVALWIILPILGISTLTIYGTLTGGTIIFTDESNFVTSGGFGPNQVSAVLGAGGCLAIIIFLMEKNLIKRLGSIVLAIGFLSLSALTFSRGGLYNAGALLIVALVHSLRSSRGRAVAVVVLIVAGLIGGYFIFPQLNTFTSGKLLERFADTNPTLRWEIAKADISLWFANPILGVGPGLAETARVFALGRIIAAHTEYTRVLAEHGSAGLLSLFVLMIITIKAYRRAPTVESRTWTIALITWPLIEMSHAAMRIVMISFLFGLAMVNWMNEKNL
jgi:hypothetical protein